MLREFGGAPFSKFKEALAELAADRLTPIGEEMRRLMADPVEIDRILADGARARPRASPIRSSPRPRTSSASSAVDGQAPLATPVPIGHDTPVPPSPQ